jgi:hypothetical protein
LLDSLLDLVSTPSGYIDGGTQKTGYNPSGFYPHTLKIDFDNEVFFNNKDHFNNSSRKNKDKIEILNIRVIEILVEMIDAIELAIWDSAVD